MKFIKYILPVFLSFLIIFYFFVREKMSTQKTSAWITDLNKLTATKNSGKFFAKDKFEKQIILEWIKTDVKSPVFSQTMKYISEISSTSYIPVEVNFLKAHPDLVSADEYFKQFEPFFKSGKDAVDWKLVKEKMHQNLMQIYNMDYSSFDAEDVYFLITAKDKDTENLLGSIIFFVTPKYPHGDIKCTSFAVATPAQNRGLGRLLMSSIFKIVPDIKRIVLSTRVTNQIALGAYRSWGFTQDLNPILEPNFKQSSEHWIFLEYKIDKSDILQNMAKTLTE